MFVKVAETDRPRDISRLIPTQLRLLLFFFPALFAYWLRSSVVSVLFSLISESSRPGNTLIIPIFAARDLAPVLAHASSHSVIGLTLPPIDANSFFSFSSTVRLVRALGENGCSLISL